MKISLIVAAAAFAVAPASLAAQESATATTAPSDFAERMALATEIAGLSRAEEQLNLAFERLRPGAVSNLLANLTQISPQRNLSAEIESGYPGGRSAFEAEYSRRYAERFRSQYPEMLEQIANYWAQNMSLEELEATATFFRTDLGSAWIRLLPGTYQNMTALGREYSLQAGIAVAGEMMGEFDSESGADGQE